MNSSELGLRLKGVNELLANVISHCYELDLSSSSGSELEELCNNLTSNQEHHLPRISESASSLGGESGDGRSLLVQLRELVTSSTFSQREDFNEFTNYLEEVVGLEGHQFEVSVCIPHTQVHICICGLR